MPFGFTNLALPMMPTNEGPIEKNGLRGSLPCIADEMIQILLDRQWDNTVLTGIH